MFFFSLSKLGISRLLLVKVWKRGRLLVVGVLGRVRSLVFTLGLVMFTVSLGVWMC